MKIYTKRGDKGKTSLYSGHEVSKSDELIHAVGTLDECNSLIGLCVALLRKETLKKAPVTFTELIQQLETIQSNLFALGAHTATPRDRSDEKKQGRTRLKAGMTQELETWIDYWQLQLPQLKNFILPGGHWIAASLHHARCECRHAERHLCPLYDKGFIDQEAITFINRLSDYLFVIARLVNHLLGVAETAWKPTES
jgi:cob(I)alamin adenosyltransferase